jgi:hypothetical protein
MDRTRHSSPQRKGSHNASSGIVFSNRNRPMKSENKIVHIEMEPAFSEMVSSSHLYDRGAKK